MPVDSVRGVGGERVATRVLSPATDNFMWEIVDDFEKLSKATPANTCDGEAAGDLGDVELSMLISAMTLDQKEMLEGLNREVLQLVDALGGSKQKYSRERRGALKKLVSEIYSPPRVTAAAKLLPCLDCTPGFALDLTTLDEHGNPWNFDDPD